MNHGEQPGGTPAAGTGAGRLSPGPKRGRAAAHERDGQPTGGAEGPGPLGAATAASVATAWLAACADEGGRVDAAAVSSRAQALKAGAPGVADGGTHQNYSAAQLAAAFAPDGSNAVDAVPAARFLAQAGFGPSVASLAAVRTRGLAAWIEDEFAAPRGERHVPRILAQHEALGGWIYTFPTFGPRNSEFMMNEAWRVMMTGPDVLRQRVIAALLEIFVITTRVGVIGIAQNQVTAAGYVDMLGDHVFGNFRQLLEGVATSAAMGVYLSHRDNLKAEYDANGVELRVPDENFARELLQLFSIGLHELNPDGSLKLRKGQPRETYTQSDVFNLARVFTGWRVATPVAGEAQWSEWAKPMVAVGLNHAPEEKRFLGKVIAAGTGPLPSLKRALDTVFAHANVGPFIGRQLIQRLVASNPSGAYVGRVAAAFDNNGMGVRGDMKAVIRAILLDPEARAGDVGVPPGNLRGKVREPMMRLVAMARALEVGDPGTVVFPVANLSGASTGIGQAPLKSPSVFNFFRPGYVPPQSELGAQGAVAPEFQLLNGPLIAASVNKINEFVRQAETYLLVDRRHLKDLARQPRALVERVSLLLTGSTLPEEDLASFTQVVGRVPARQATERTEVALQLVASSAAFLIQAW